MCVAGKGRLDPKVQSSGFDIIKEGSGMLACTTQDVGARFPVWTGKGVVKPEHQRGEKASVRKKHFFRFFVGAVV